MGASIQFWFELASTYSYVAAMRVEEEARARGVGVVWRPFLLGPLFTAQLGIRDSPFNVHPVRGRYMWRDVERLCARYGLPWRRPSVFPRNSVRASRVVCACLETPNLPALVRALYEANFARDEEISDPAVLGGVLTRTGYDAQATLERAESAEVKQRLRALTGEAEALGIFGAPDFVAGSELFFGQDRLEDALEWAVAGDRSGGSGSPP